MSLIFDSFPTKERAKNFAKEVECVFNRDWEIVEEDYPPFRSPVVLIDRMTKADEYDFPAEKRIIIMAGRHGGLFQGT